MGSIDDVQIANTINSVIAILLVVYLKETIRKDLKILVKRGEIEAHQQTVVLDGKRYSPMVYGSLDGFLTDVEQAEAILAENLMIGKM